MKTRVGRDSFSCCCYDLVLACHVCQGPQVRRAPDCVASGLRVVRSKRALVCLGMCRLLFLLRLGLLCCFRKFALFLAGRSAPGVFNVVLNAGLRFFSPPAREVPSLGMSLGARSHG